MANDVFAGYRCSITCLWHRRRHAPSIIEELRAVHPRELHARGVVDNPAYAEPGDFLSRRAPTAWPATPPVTEIDLTVRDPQGVAACRAAVAGWATRYHFVPTAVRQVVAAVHEVVVNGLQHGRPPVRVRAWSREANLVVDIEDRGGQPVPAHAGYQPPAGAADPAGLWVARQLTDVLVTQTGGELTTARMYFPYAETHRNLDIPAQVRAAAGTTATARPAQ
jgi:anti-sigma regulatory factor (Ser/Thr protein kinase)